jgi:hypothetical protein
MIVPVHAHLRISRLAAGDAAVILRTRALRPSAESHLVPIKPPQGAHYGFHH